jgi:ferric-dicitrate binding protein FerR (iron transport regulator)
MNSQSIHLISRYFSREISHEEYLHLKSTLGSISDAELSGILFEQWEHFQTSKRHDIPEFEEISHRIGFDREAAISRPVRQWYAMALKIAAMFLLPLFITLSAYFFLKNKAMDSFLNRKYTVAMHNGDRGEVVLPDGTKVYLNSATTISYAPDFGKKTRTITLNGEALLHVAKDRSKPFLVETQTMTVKVLGTTFNVRAHDNDSTTETSLIEGAVNITTKENHPRTLSLKPNQKAVVNIYQGKAFVEKTDLYAETAWRRGELIFRSSTFDEIVRQLETFYGVEIDLVGTGNRKEYFSGTFQEDNLGAALRILQQHYHFSYSIVGKKAKISFY